MSHINTNYTTYDVAYYYADLKRVPRLSEEQRRHLLTSHATIPPTPEETMQIKHALIESYLPLATSLTIALFPHCHDRFADLIGEANLTVVEVITRTDLTQIENLTSYLAAWIKGRLKEAMRKNHVIYLPSYARASAQARGTPEPFAALAHLLSLDELRETNPLEEPHASPLTPSHAAPPRDPQHRVLVETYLSYLSPRAQAIVRLRYGLCEDNEHRHSTQEIMAQLGLSRDLVLTTEHDALTRLRALVEGKATIGTRHGRPCICYPQAHASSPTPEQEVTLRRITTELEAQGHFVTGRLLAKAAGVSEARAFTFLRLHRTQTPQQARISHRHRQLEATYRRLATHGQAVSSVHLAREAHVGKPAALAFLKAQRSHHDAAASQTR